MTLQSFGEHETSAVTKVGNDRFKGCRHQGCGMANQGPRGILERRERGPLGSRGGEFGPRGNSGKDFGAFLPVRGGARSRGARHRRSGYHAGRWMEVAADAAAIRREDQCGKVRNGEGGGGAGKGFE
jgi:hypothetical protein